MNSVDTFAAMPLPKVLLCLYATERDLDRLTTRRRDIMAELAARVLAQQSEQPSTPPTTP